MPALSLFPESDPYEDGVLAVGDGHRLYWEVSGNPEGKPVLVLHGGPGSGRSPFLRRLFDPAAYRIVQFDQRNCGRSTPHASDPGIDLATNTTADLIEDCERIRSPCPRATATVISPPPTAGCSTTPIPSVASAPRRRGARGRMSTSAPTRGTSRCALRRCALRLCFARIVTHYWANAAFLDDGQLLRDARRLAGIPAVLIHGRLDVSAPADFARQLARAWRDAELVLVDDAGHGAGHPSTRAAILAATARFAV